MQGQYFIMTKKKTLHNKLSNGEVLNLSANIIEDILELNSAPNTIYSDKTIIYHLINAAEHRVFEASKIYDF